MAKSKLTEIELTIKKHILPTVDNSYQRSVSYSQFSLYSQCPHRWALKYVENKEPHQASIHTTLLTNSPY